jgi:hypothetical protein
VVARRAAMVALYAVMRALLRIVRLLCEHVCAGHGRVVVCRCEGRGVVLIGGVWVVSVAAEAVDGGWWWGGDLVRAWRKVGVVFEVWAWRLPTSPLICSAVLVELGRCDVGVWRSIGGWLGGKCGSLVVCNRIGVCSGRGVVSVVAYVLLVALAVASLLGVVVVVALDGRPDGRL